MGEYNYEGDEKFAVSVTDLALSLYQCYTPTIIKGIIESKHSTTLSKKRIYPTSKLWNDIDAYYKINIVIIHCQTYYNFVLIIDTRIYWMVIKCTLQTIILKLAILLSLLL